MPCRELPTEGRELRNQGRELAPKLTVSLPEPATLVPAARNLHSRIRCLAFLDEPLVGVGDAYVTLAEIRSISEDEVTGTSRIYKAFVPTAKLARTLRLKALERWPMQVSVAACDERELRILAAVR